jgi:Xaa-Pro aminopeptidase
MESVIEKVFASLDGVRVPDAIFVYNRDHGDRNFLYLTGLPGGVFENCGLLCERGRRLTIFSTTLEEEILRGVDGYTEFLVYRNEKERNELLKEKLSRYGRIGISFDRTAHSLYLSLQDLIGETELLDVSAAFRRSRMIKSAEEIERIRKACGIASRVAGEFPLFLKRGITERELAAEVDYRMKRLGARGPAFETIVAFSPNNSKPHYSGSDVSLEAGDTVLLDFGADYEGYVSDITRTYLTGQPGEELRHCYKTVLESQRIALELISDGKSTEQAEKEVKEFIDRFEEYRGRFIHGLGHSIGLSVHDNSYPGPEFDKLFRENMVLTVEPGIYLPGRFGIRIEDDILVHKGACEVLTDAPKELKFYEI